MSLPLYIHGRPSKAVTLQASYGLESTMAQFTLRAGLAPFVGALGVVVGWLLGMDSSGRLVLLTYLLVGHLCLCNTCLFLLHLMQVFSVCHSL